MIQIFILGSSSVYGVGGENGGWADLLKQSLHRKMYGQGGVGEQYEIYNLGKSGATIEFVLNTFPEQLETYGRNQKTIIIVSVGGNNSKAEERPDNFVSTPEEYEQQMAQLLDMLKAKSDQVIAVGSGYVDETKTNPIGNPLTGGKSYFDNARRAIFNAIYKRLCEERGMPLVEIEIDQQEWLGSYLYSDGLHANQKGHEYICAKVYREMEKII